MLHSATEDAHHYSLGRTQARAEEKCDEEEAAERNPSFPLGVRGRVWSGGVKLNVGKQARKVLV